MSREYVKIKNISAASTTGKVWVSFLEHDHEYILIMRREERSLRYSLFPSAKDVSFAEL